MSGIYVSLNLFFKGGGGGEEESWPCTHTSLSLSLLSFCVHLSDSIKIGSDTMAFAWALEKTMPSAQGENYVCMRGIRRRSPGLSCC